MRDSPLQEAVGPVAIEVYRHLFTALAEEMGASLRRAAYSPNIKERRDYSCAIFSPEGIPVAQGDHMPVHLGAMPMSISAVLDTLGPLESTDVAMVNDPYEGGTHLPDITLVSAVFDASGRTRLGYVAARAHHSDVGGMSPGSMPLAREIYQEGLRIPPVLLVRKGIRVADIWRLVLANVRTPAERQGDLDAQLGALYTGANRLSELATRRSASRVLAAQEALVGYGDRLLREGIRMIPDGRWTASESLEGDGIDDEPIPIHVAVEVYGDRLRVDFGGSSHQVRGGVNAPAAVTASATRYVVRCVVEDLLGTSLPAGGGAMAPLELALPEASVVNASPPAAVAAGNVETSQRITDVVLQAFAVAMPDRLPALSQGTMNNTAIGGVDPRSGEPFAYYETVGGGMGAGPSGPGLSGVHTHMSNTLNTPIEALEHAYPFRVTRYSIRRRTGGSGLHQGGDGLRRDLELRVAAEVTLISERRLEGPAGRGGGARGAPGSNVLLREGRSEPLPSKVTFRAEPGDIVSVRSPGGGGWGRPSAES